MVLGVDVVLGGVLSGVGCGGESKLLGLPVCNSFVKHTYNKIRVTRSVS